MSTRHTTAFVESLLRLVGLDWPVPGFGTPSRRQKTLAVKMPCRGSNGPLDFRKHWRSRVHRRMIARHGATSLRPDGNGPESARTEIMSVTRRYCLTYSARSRQKQEIAGGEPSERRRGYDA